MRHSNDHNDFRLIADLPHRSELDFQGKAYLPPPGPTSLTAWYDRSYRVLREDWVQDCREQLRNAKSWNGRRSIERRVGINGIDYVGKFRTLCVVLTLNIRDDHPTQDMTFKKRRSYWERCEKSLFPEASLLLIRGPDGGECLALVTARDAEMLAGPKPLPCEAENSYPGSYRSTPSYPGSYRSTPSYPGAYRSTPSYPGSYRSTPSYPSFTSKQTNVGEVPGGVSLRPQIGVLLLGEQGMYDSAASARILRFMSAGNVLMATQISSQFFSFLPVLRVLKRSRSLRLSPILLGNVKEPGLPQYLKGFDLQSHMPAELNQSQRDALKLAFSREVALIQGPPGTGKTHVIKAMIRIIYHFFPDWKVLFMAYTNHASDQVLEGLVNEGMTGIMRLGGQSKSEVLQEYLLPKIKLKKKLPFPVEAKYTMEWLYRKVEFHESEIAEAQLDFVGAPRDWDWPVASAFIRKKHYAKFKELDMTSYLGIRDGFEVVREEKLREDTKWKAWKGGFQPDTDSLSSGSIYASAGREDSIWKMKPVERLGLISEWMHEASGDTGEAYERAVTALNGLHEVKNKLQDAGLLGELSYLRYYRPRVVGLTSSGAAMRVNVLEEYKPDVLIVEEAGEMLETHVFAACTSDLQHLIMIGDHKQLRPKIVTHELSVASQVGHDLDRSLFERLILQGSKHITLNTQHRMHPAIVKPLYDLNIYPGLQSHKDTSSRELIPGIPDRFVFIDHRVLESSEGLSKINLYEAEMTVKICFYLLQQGVSKGSITILSPYLAQVKTIRDILHQRLQLPVNINERDLDDMDAQGFEVQHEQEGDDETTVKVSSVDNYQGEENKVVIVSLVRSNAYNNIGFLKEPERLTVLLTRSQCLQIMIGNSECLKNASNEAGAQRWAQLFKSLDERGHVRMGLPIKCANHSFEQLMASPEEFEDNSPQGGCSVRCEGKLSCGHPCPVSCHPLSSLHDTYPCRVALPVKCNHGHDCHAACANVARKDWSCDVCDEKRRSCIDKIESAHKELTTFDLLESCF